MAGGKGAIEPGRELKLTTGERRTPAQRKAKRPRPIEGRALLAGLLVLAALPGAGCSLTERIPGFLTRELDDTSITARVRANLIQRGALEQLEITVATDEGEVFLVGRTPGESERREAEEAARQVSGVWSVVNELRIGGRALSTPETDAALRSRIRSALREDPDVPGLQIQVLAYEREIYLIGRVSSELQRSRALGIVRDDGGVRRIHNYLKAGQILERDR